MRLLFASASNIKNVKRIKFDLNNILGFGHAPLPKVVMAVLLLEPENYHNITLPAKKSIDIVSRRVTRR